MSCLSAGEVGERLARAGRLELRPLCVCGSAKAPEDTVMVADVVRSGHRCLAKAILLVSAGKADGVYLGGSAVRGVCPGALGWLGFAEFPESICDDLSTGGEDAMYLKESPGHCAWTLRKVGRIRPQDRYVVVRPCEKAGDEKPLSYLCFGSAEQVRNLCGLLHFGSDAPFGQIDAAWGSHCALFVSYPAGMAPGAPKETAFLGPTAPDGNLWFPPDLMALGVPARLAERMAENVDRSFAGRRAESTYPEARDKEVQKALKGRHG